MLRANAIEKSFKRNNVLKDVSFDVAEGELLHIKGGNGCGKSTLLKILAGLISQDSGSMELAPNVKIGALIENPNFIESESLKYNLRFLYSLTNTYTAEAEARIRQLTERFFLDFDNPSSIKKYSLGMRQKAGIIQAVMEDQNLILLDEPTRGLDQDSLHVFNELLEELKREGKSSIICAHDGIEGIRFTRTYELKNGKIYESSQL